MKFPSWTHLSIILFLELQLEAKFSLMVPPILQVSMNNTVYTLQLQVPISQQQPGLVLDHKPSTLQTV